MKKRFGMSVLTFLVAISVLCPPVFASNPLSTHSYQTERELFAEKLILDEELEIASITFVQKGESYRDWRIEEEIEYIPIPFLTRLAGESITLTTSRTIVDFVQLEIPKGKTLTIPEGKTLTIYGEIVVYGELVNNGTIIVGDMEWESKTKRSIDPEGTDQSRIRNYGKLENAGALELLHGSVHTVGAGALHNSGTIAIRNTDDTLHGLQFTAQTQNGKTLDAETVNTGVIFVENVGGVGLHIREGCAFDNQGDIYKTKGAVVRGAYTGNKSRWKPGDEAN